MNPLSDIEIFVRVVEIGNFAEAAKTLGISRSYVSKCISALEGRLGAKLLYRTTRQVAPTDTGLRFYESCAPLLAGLAQAEAQVLDDRDLPRGTLRITAPQVFGLHYLAPVFARFSLRYPELRLVVDYHDRRVNIIEEGFDLAIRGGWLGDSSLVAKKLWGFEIVIAASPDYLQRRGIPERPEDLSRHSCLIYSGNREPYRWGFEGPKGPLSVPVSGPMEANSAAAIVEAGCQGLGLIYQPDFAVFDALASGKLQRVLADYRAQDGAFWAVYPHRKHVSARIRLLIEHLMESVDPAAWSIRPKSEEEKEAPPAAR